MTAIKTYDILLSDDRLSIDVCRQFVAGTGNGAIVIFEGTVRNRTSDKPVVRLEFEAYHNMAIPQMEKIAVECLAGYDIDRIAMHHRVGSLDIGESPVIIAVSAPHRKAAFQACSYAIDTLKDTVPIWKKEIFEDGEVWVAAHP